MTRKKVKRMTLRIDRQGKPCLSVPLNAARGEIEDFLRSCSGWLARNAGQRSFFSLPDALRDGDEVMILGENRRISLVSGLKASLFFREGRPVLAMRGPDDPMKAASAYEKALTDLALDVFRRRLAIYADVIPKRFGVPEIRIRKMTSRWGSANQKTKEIHLSLYLIKTPLECIDSVVLHEAVHFTHMDHGDGFYDMLLRRMPDYKQRSRKLKEYARH
ncbi:MAG: M48 family metallopeptidase [Oscillospiraceae bacterium]|nr:M48 family metallopeptidase [Oscillospiraceae bacterium]